MTTSQSPLSDLQAQADRIAKMIKAIERDANPARNRDTITFAVAMDDKIIKIEIPWTTVRETSEAGIAEYILKHMRGGNDVH